MRKVLFVLLLLGSSSALLCAPESDPLSFPMLAVRAKQVVIACKLYAKANGGPPSDLLLLIPDFMPEFSDLQCMLCPEETVGYDYFAVPKNAPKRMMLRSKKPTKEGWWLIIYNTGEAKLTAEKEPKDQKNEDGKREAPRDDEKRVMNRGAEHARCREGT
jgi:hypothetical protein